MDDASRIAQLRETLHQCNYDYYVLTHSNVTDAEYDALYAELQALEKKYPELADPNSPTKRIGAESTGFKKARHDRRMLSLDNMKTPADVINYLGTEEVMMEPKIDGASLKLIYRKGRLVQAITRGNGMEGDDVTAQARAIKNVPLVLREVISIEVVGEVYMTYTVFNALNQQLEADGKDLMANPRNAAAGAIKLKDPREVTARKISFVAYGTTSDFVGISTHSQLTEELAAMGFQNVTMLPSTEPAQSLADSFEIEDEASLEERIDKADISRKLLDLPTDGLVFKINNLDKQRELGEGNKYPNYACAFKFAPERKQTVLLGVAIQIGRTGKVTPVAELQPVLLGGTTVRRASLCNQDEVERLGVDIGDSVWVEKSAEIIPKIMGVAVKNTPDVYKIPSKCPCCDSPLTRPDGFVDTYCLNVDCEDQVFERLLHACGKSALDIDGCGETLIRELMLHGVRKLSDIFTINPAFLKTAARRRFEAGRATCAAQPYWRKLHALGIEGFGQTLSQEVAGRWLCMELAFNQSDALRSMVGDVVYNNICDYFTRYGEEYDALDGFIRMTSDPKASGPLTGLSFCITGDLASGSRNEVSKRIEKAGGIVKNSVSKHLSYLIQGTETGRTKRATAEKYGIPIITEEKLFEMMGQQMPTLKTWEDKEY